MFFVFTGDKRVLFDKLNTNEIKNILDQIKVYELTE